MRHERAVLPGLGVGRHRTPRQGASLMELVSYLAGERWTDRPRCTHPMLAALARAVNDATTDEARPLLARLAPSLVDLVSDDPHWEVEIALRAATAALPAASGERQKALAVGVLAAERTLDLLDGREPGTLRPESERALATAPGAEVWARRFIRSGSAGASGFLERGAPAVVQTSVQGIAEACVDNPDARLADLLAGSVEECRTWAGMRPLPATDLPHEVWRDVCRPVRVG